MTTKNPSDFACMQMPIQALITDKHEWTYFELNVLDSLDADESLAAGSTVRVTWNPNREPYAAPSWASRGI